MELKRLRGIQDGVTWPKENIDLPVISYQSCECCNPSHTFTFWPSAHWHVTVQEQSQTRPLVLVSGFIHDVGTFLDEHPGGRHLLAKQIGKDASTAFFGGVYEHSNAAHNVSVVCVYLVPRRCADHTRRVPKLLSMMRVGVLHGGIPHALEEKAIPPSQHLRVMRYSEAQAVKNSETDAKNVNVAA